MPFANREFLFGQRVISGSMRNQHLKLQIANLLPRRRVKSSAKRKPSKRSSVLRNPARRDGRQQHRANEAERDGKPRDVQHGRQHGHTEKEVAITAKGTNASQRQREPAQRARTSR